MAWNAGKISQQCFLCASALTQIESLYDDMINAYQARSMTVLLLLHKNQCDAMSFQMTKISHVVYQSFGT